MFVFQRLHPLPPAFSFYLMPLVCLLTDVEYPVLTLRVCTCVDQHTRNGPSAVRSHMNAARLLSPLAVRVRESCHVSTLYWLPVGRCVFKRTLSYFDLKADVHSRHAAAATRVLTEVFLSAVCSMQQSLHGELIHFCRLKHLLSNQPGLFMEGCFRGHFKP